MSSPPVTPAPKGRKAGATDDDIGNDLMILLIASNPAITFNYKTMSAISGSMTPFALEHRFRKIKAKAKEVREKAGDIEGLEAVKSTPKRKQSVAHEEGGDGTLSPVSTKKRKVGGNGVNEVIKENGDTPTRKTIGKKGTANPVKKEQKSKKSAVMVKDEEDYGEEEETAGQADSESAEGLSEMKFE